MSLFLSKNSVFSFSNYTYSSSLSLQIPVNLQSSLSNSEVSQDSSIDIAEGAWQNLGPLFLM
jgi:hypothetical protein